MKKPKSFDRVTATSAAADWTLSASPTTTISGYRSSPSQRCCRSNDSSSTGTTRMAGLCRDHHTHSVPAVPQTGSETCALPTSPPLSKGVPPSPNKPPLRSSPRSQRRTRGRGGGGSNVTLRSGAQRAILEKQAAAIVLQLVDTEKLAKELLRRALCMTAWRAILQAPRLHRPIPARSGGTPSRRSAASRPSLQCHRCQKHLRIWRRIHPSVSKTGRRHSARR